MSNKKINQISLKWGTLKSWDLETAEAIQLIKEYYEDPVSISVALHKNTEKQKEVICKLIDISDSIWNDWEDKEMTKEEAKEYVLNFDKSE